MELSAGRRNAAVYGIVHSVAPAKLIRPAGHSVHTFNKAYMPAVHCTAGTHDEAPATTLVVPAAHAVQLEPVPLYPGAH